MVLLCILLFLQCLLKLVGQSYSENMALYLPIGKFAWLAGVRIVLCFYIRLIFCNNILFLVVHTVAMTVFAHLYIFITFIPSCLTNIDLSPLKIYPRSGVFFCTYVKVKCLRFLVCSQIFE